METSSPFTFLSNLTSSVFKLAGKMQAPTWMVDELQQRLVLLLNHVLMQEPEAMARLVRANGQVIRAHWGNYSLGLIATPAGLLDRAGPNALASLNIRFTDESAKAMVQNLLAGNKPSISIDGDVQLAADIQWLADNVRWDIEEDISRVVGDAPARALSTVAGQIMSTLRGFLVTQHFDKNSVRAPKHPV